MLQKKGAQKEAGREEGREERKSQGKRGERKNLGAHLCTYERTCKDEWRRGRGADVGKRVRREGEKKMGRGIREAREAQKKREKVRITLPRILSPAPRGCT